MRALLCEMVTASRAASVTPGGGASVATERPPEGQNRLCEWTQYREQRAWVGQETASKEWIS